MNPFVAWTITVLGVVSLGLVGRSLLGPDRVERVDKTAIVAFLAVILPNLTTAIGAFTGGQVYGTDTFFNRVTTFNGISAQVNAVANPSLLLVTLLILALSLVQRSRPNVAPALFALLLMVSALAAWTNGGALLTGPRAVLFALVACAVFLQRGRSVLSGAGLGLALLASVSAIGTALAPQAVTLPCESRKCGAFGVLLVGVAGDNNSFGLLMALGVPVVYFGVRRYGIHLAALLTLLALGSGSRTAQVAAVLTFIVIVWRHLSSRSSTQQADRVAVATAITGLVTMAIVPFVGLESDALTGRAGLWAIALERIGANPFGYGPDSWSTLVTIGVIPRSAGYATHNQGLEVLYVAGALGLAIMLTLGVVLTVKNSGSLGRLAVLTLPVIVCGIAERPWSLGAIDWMSWSILVVLLVDFRSAADVLPVSSAPRSNKRESFDPRR